MNDARQFSIEIDADIAGVERDVLRQTQAIALQAHEGVVRRTPVDTGAARASWVCSVGAPSDDIPGIGEGLGVAPILAMTRPDLVYVQSSIAYMNRLENGWSKQAPLGMVAITVAEIKAGLGR